MNIEIMLAASIASTIFLLFTSIKLSIENARLRALSDLKQLIQAIEDGEKISKIGLLWTSFRAIMYA